MDETQGEATFPTACQVTLRTTSGTVPGTVLKAAREVGVSVVSLMLNVMIYKKIDPKTASPACSLYGIHSSDRRGTAHFVRYFRT